MPEPIAKGSKGEATADVAETHQAYEESGFR